MPRGEIANDDLPASEPDDGSDGDQPQQVHNRAEGRADLGALHDGAESFLHFIGKTLLFEFFLGERFHHPYPGDGFFQHRGGCRQAVLH